MNKNNRLLYDYLYSKGFTENPKDIYKKIFDYNEDELIDFFRNCYKNINSDISKSISSYDFVANSTLSPEPIPCSDLGCRLEKVDKLSRISLLYSDKIRIRNPFDKYLLRYATIFDQIARADLSNDIIVLFELKPLIESNYITFTSETHHFCEECLDKIYSDFPDKYENRVDKIEKKIKKLYKKHTSFELLEDQGECGVLAINFEHDGLHDHSGMVLSSEMFKNKFNKIRKRKNKTFSDKEIDKYKLFDLNIFSNLLTDLLVQNWYSIVSNSNIITNRNLDITLINTLNKRETQNQNFNIEKHLQHTIPSFDNIKIENLIELREKEGECFINYRNELESHLKKLKGYSISELSDLKNDVIRPKVESIETTVKKFKKANKKSIISSVASGAVSLTLGLYCDIIPEPVANAILGLGSYHSAKGIIESSIKNKPENFVYDDKFYFLYKATNN